MKNNFWKIVTGLCTILGLYAAFHAVDSYYVKQSYLTLCLAQTDLKIDSIKREVALQRAYNDFNFWTKLEAELTVMQMQNQNNEAIIRKLDEARKKKEESENNMKILLER
jgi:hypothetical protein